MKHKEKHKKDQGVRHMLNHLFSRISFMLIAMLVCLVVNAQTSEITVSGTVVDDSGNPLIGASITEYGTSNGANTDLDGKYSISVLETATLQFSFIGFLDQNIRVNSRRSIDVKLVEDSKLLDEIVVTALGIKREAKALGYAMTELKGDDLDINVINPISALQGKAAGVHISGSDGGMFGSSKILIRGVSTLGNNNQPIFVVDGVILDNGVHAKEVDFETNSVDFGSELKNLNPNDFETVSILKGAAATALYGSRGINGAIVIATKGGSAIKGFGVSVNQSIGIESVNTLPKFQTVFGHGSWATSGATRRANPWNTNDFEIVDGVETVLYGGNYWGPKYDGRQVVGYDGDMISYSPNKNYYKDAFQTGFNSNTNIVVRGGNTKTTFYNSLGYHYAEGVVDNNEFTRLSNMLKASQKISERVKLTGSFTFAVSKPKNPQLSIGERMSTSAVGPLYNTKFYKNKYKGDNHAGMASTTYSDKYGRVPNKGMWWDIYENSDTRRETVIRPTVELDVKILDWLNFKTEANMNYYFTDREVKNLGTGYMNVGTGDDTGGKYSMEQREKKQTTLAGSFTANKKLGDFGIGGFVRGEFYDMKEKFLEATTKGGLIIPGQYFLTNSNEPIETKGKYQGKKRILSAIAAANLSWKDQIYLDITARNDWSSAMVKKDGVGDMSYFYPSVSGSWIASETFKENLPAWVSFLKLRASLAVVGSDTDAYKIIQGYELQSLLQADGKNIHMQPIPDMLIQNNIKPEKKKSWEVGVDFRFLNDRVGIDMTYYKENTTNQIMEIDKAAASGVKKYLLNAGDIQNQGIELALKTIPFRNKDWKWNLDLTYTRNRNKIVALHESASSFIRLAGYENGYNFRIASVAKVGGAYGTLMSDAMPKRDENGNKILKYSEGARVGYYERSGNVEDLGFSINPDFLGSVGTSLTWKNFSFNALLDVRYGGYIASYSNRYSMAYGLHENSLFGRTTEYGGLTYVSIHDGITYTDGIIPEGVFGANTKVSVPGYAEKQNIGGMTYQEAVNAGFIDPAHASTFYRYKGDWGLGTVDNDWLHKVKYIAVREVSLAYKVPQPFAEKLGARGLNVGLSARNLGYLYNSLPNNLNPEAVRGNTAAEFRERGFAPNRASYTMNIGIDF